MKEEEGADMMTPSSNRCKCLDRDDRPQPLRYGFP
jgi:hypothetical protein